MQDVQGLSNRPGAPDCVKWSEDGVLAVAAGHSVSLLNPAGLGAGPRAFASPGNSCDVLVLQAPGTPAQPTADAHHELANLRQGAMVSQYPVLQLSLQARSIAWSPAGCSSSAGCLLATVTNDHQVLVYGPPSGATCEWQRVADLSGRLVQRLEQTGWQDLAPQPPQPPAADATLRLRGGAKRKRPGEPRQGSEGGVYRPAAAFHAAVGQAVEVMTAEEGLEGCWFGGTIQDLQGGWALVAYAALQESEEEGASPLREWFPLPGQRQGPPPSQPAGADGQPLAAHPAEAAPQLRPAPPPKKSAVGGARRVGDVCDAFIDDGWWEGTRVAELQDGGKRCVVEVAGERHAVAREHTRRCLLYQDGGWEVLVPAVPGDAAPPAQAAPQPTPGQSGGSEKQAARPLVAGAQPAGAGASAVAPASAEAARGRPAKRHRAQSAAREAAVGWEGSEEVQEEETEEEETEEEEEEEEEETEEEEGPPQQGRAAAQHAGTEQQQEAKQARRRPPRKSANPQAAAVEGAARAQREPAAAAPPPAKKGGGKRGQAPPPTYAVPVGFDPAVLPPVDLASPKAARASVPLAFCRRFLALRREVPHDELPSYETTSTHLKGVDAQLVAQAVAELAAAHGAALAALGKSLDAKWLNTEGRQRLRMVWDRTRNKLLGGFKVAEGDASEPELSSSTEEEEGGGGGGGAGSAAGQRIRRRRASSAGGGSAGADSAGSGSEEGDGARDGGEAQRGSQGRRSGPGSAAALDYPPHELPEGFSWRDLPGVDPSNESSAKASLALAAVRRFLVLRKQYEEGGEEFPQYPGSSSHLKGRDAWLVERVTREFATGYAQLMDDLKWSVKTLQTNWLARLRQKWERTSGRVEPGFSLEPEPVEAAALLAVAEGDAGLATQRGPRLQNRPSARKPGRGGGGLRRASSAAGGSASRLSLGDGGGEAGGGGALAGSESEGEAATQQRARRRKELAAATAAQRMRSGGGATGLASAAYQSRLLGTSSLSCAWSPLVPCGGGSGGQEQQHSQQGEEQQEGPGAATPPARCCFLAVGAKAGRVWLWRYRLPRRYRLPPPPGEPGGSFELVGCLAGSPGAWLTRLAWQQLGGGGDDGGTLLLAVGCSDGAVLLYGAAARQLAVLPAAAERLEEGAAAPLPLPAAMQRWGVPCPPDLLGVTTLALQACPASGDGPCRLLLAAGKAAGSLAVWRSGEVAGGSDGDAAAKALSRGAASWLGHSVQGTRAVTGLAWLPCEQQGAAGAAGAAPLLLACTQDGATACYRPAAAPAAPALQAAAGAPQPASGRRRSKERGHCALGLALSPGGLFATVARLSLPPAAEVVRSLQAHERVVQCLLQLDRLAGPDAPLEAAPALAAALQRLATPPCDGHGQLPPLPASGAWELASLLRLQARWQAAATGSAGSAAGAAAAAELVPAGAAQLLELLEQPVVEAAAAAAAASADLLPAVAPPAWRRLQLATALRHLLHPARLLAAAAARARQELRVVAASAALPARLPPPAAPVKQEEVEEAEEEGEEEGEAPPQPSAELVAQHGAFASLMVPPTAPRAAEPKPQRPPRPRPAPPPAQAEAADDEAAAALVERWAAAVERNEVLLLQRGLHAALAPLLPAGDEAEGGGGGGGEVTLSQLLMADWITLNVRHPLLLNEMLPLAGGVYMMAEEDIPEPEGGGMPTRETSALLDAAVALSGSGVAAATRAGGGTETGGAHLPRCPASLLLCEQRPHWVCRVCQRQYRQPAGTSGEAAAGGAVPACVFCGQLLGPSGPPIIFNPPCCS